MPIAIMIVSSASSPSASKLIGFNVISIKITCIPTITNPLTVPTNISATNNASNLLMFSHHLN